MSIIPELTTVELSKFWDCVNIAGEDECWFWKPNHTDYGTFAIKRNNSWKNYKAHRISLLIKTGSQEEHARHSCNNPGCCNPKHLQWGSHLDNMQDKVRSGRQHHPVGTTNGRSVLNEELVLQIRADFNTGKYTKVQLGNKYNVTDTNIRKIVNRLTWKNI